MSAVSYWIWLSSLGVSPRAKAAVVRRFGDAEKAFFSPLGALAATEGVASAEGEILERRDLHAVQEILEDCDKQGLSILTLQDAAYPGRLKQIFAPPVVLYVKGSLGAIDDEAAIAVIGTRSASPYGLKMGRQLAWEITHCGGLVISGLTTGVDAAAADGALLAGGRCIGVLGTAHEFQDGELAARVAERGALISEHAPGTRSLRSHFRDRNRISAGLSVGVLAVEAPEKSGTLLFVAEALEQGREIFAVPGNADAPGCRGTNGLLKQGAKPVTCGWDVMCEFSARFPGRVAERYDPALTVGEKPPAEPKKEIDKEKGGEYIDFRQQLAGLSETQLKIVAAIDKEPTHIDDIVERTGLGAAAVLTQLTLMTVKGIVRRAPGNRVALNIQRK